nr:MAG: replication initiator protein [Microvirus sp.]
MPCYHPMDAYQSKWPKPNGKSSIYFPQQVQNPSNYKAIKLPCGQCVGCRLERSRQWAIRCTHEASQYKNNCFITLTYSDKYLPDDGSLRMADFQKFMKRLRKKYGDKIRFYHCGEYGEKLGRPHYHAIIFNFDFPDKYQYKKTKQGHAVFRSPSLEELWPFGISEIGSVTFESTAYVARYIMKKINGPAADEHYMDPLTGVLKKPEYTTMSRRPGIGKNWFDKFHTDVFPSDEVVIKNMRMRPPKYYDRQFELIDPDQFAIIKLQREDNAKKHLDDNTEARLNAKEQVANSRLSNLPRQLK